MTYENSIEPEAPVSDKMVKLLFAWAVVYSIGGNRRVISMLTGQINSSPGAQLMKDACEQIVDFHIDEKTSYYICYTDVCLNHVNKLVNALPKKLKVVVESRYKLYEGLSIKDKAKRLHINRSTYYRRLDRAHHVIDAAMDWRLTR